MSQSFWGRDPKDVALDLSGLTLRVGNKKAIIFNATPYDRSEQQRGLYKPMLEMAAGDVYCPKLMTSVLLLITTGTGETLGSCVRIDDIQIGGIRHEGAGRVTAALGITTAKSRGVARIVDDICVEVSLDAHPLQASQDKASGKPKREPSIGPKVLAKLLPQILKKYLAERPPISFEDYLNNLLRECKSEGDLRRKIV